MDPYIDYPMLALEAAIGIDMYLKGKQNKYQKELEQLADELDSVSKTEMSPIQLTMFAELIYGQDRESHKGKNIKEVNLQIRLLSKDLSDMTVLSKEKQEFLKQTCIELSNQFSRYSHPFRSYMVA